LKALSTFLDSAPDPPPVRGQQSKFRNFGFEVRYPDRTLVYDEPSEERHEVNIYNTMWLTVGLSIRPSHDDWFLTHLLRGTVISKWSTVGDGVTPYEQRKDKHGYRPVPEMLAIHDPLILKSFSSQSRYDFKIALHFQMLKTVSPGIAVLSPVA
jgi:hypothetical protein